MSCSVSHYKRGNRIPDNVCWKGESYNFFSKYSYISLSLPNVNKRLRQKKKWLKSYMDVEMFK